MSYITDHFGPTHTAVPFGTPLYTDGPREAAAKAAKGILDDTADVYDIVTLAEFLVGDGDAQPAPAIAAPAPVSDAERTAFHYYVTDEEGERACLSGHLDDEGDYAFIVSVNGGRPAGLTRSETADLRDKLTALLGS